MTRTPKRKLKVGDPVMLPSGLVTKLTDIQYEHNRYRLLEAASGWQYGIEYLQPADWETEARKWRREALRQYPTREAYEAACAALEKHRARADEAKELLLDAMGIMMVYDVPVHQRHRIIEGVRTLYPDTPAPKEGTPDASLD